MTPEEMRKKWPELYPVFVSLLQEKMMLTEGLAELEAQADELYAKVEEARKAWEEVREKIVEREGDGRLREVSNQIAALARSMGAASLKAEPGRLGVERGG